MDTKCVPADEKSVALAAELLAKSLKKNLDKLCKLSEEELVEQRYAKFRAIGTFLENAGK